MVLKGFVVVDESVRIEDGRFAVLDTLAADVGPGSVVFLTIEEIVVLKTLPAVTLVLLPQLVPLAVLFPHLVALTFGVVLVLLLGVIASPVLLSQPEAVELPPRLTTVLLPQSVALPFIFAPAPFPVLVAMFLGVVLVAEMRFVVIDLVVVGVEVAVEVDGETGALKCPGENSFNTTLKYVPVLEPLNTLFETASAKYPAGSGRNSAFTRLLTALRNTSPLLVN